MVNNNMLMEVGDFASKVINTHNFYLIGAGGGAALGAAVGYFPFVASMGPFAYLTAGLGAEVGTVVGGTIGACYGNSLETPFSSYLDSNNESLLSGAESATIHYDAL